MRIGVPRALFYYMYYPFWKIFFEALGHEVILSSPTNKKILKDGLEFAVDDACLPVKVFHGHIVDLLDRVDVLFIPRIISIEPGEFICPKFLGLPDMVKSSIPDLPPIIDSNLSVYKNRKDLIGHAKSIGTDLGHSSRLVLKAYMIASTKFNSYKKFQISHEQLPLDSGQKSFFDSNSSYFSRHKNKCLGENTLNVLLLGHPYNIYDNYISMNLITKLQKNGIKVITPEIIPVKNISAGAKNLKKRLFWTMGKNIIGSTYYYMDCGKALDGIIHLASFGCGPDSIVGELLERKLSRNRLVPFLRINIDEHSGEEGFNTRLEAFIDVIEGRRRN